MLWLYKGAFYHQFFLLVASLWNLNSDHPSLFTFGQRCRFWVLTIILFLIRPLGDLLWLLDEIIFPQYHSMRVEAPVFIVSGPRTGSTSLHETFMELNDLEDNVQFTSFTLFELFFPFLTWQYTLWFVSSFLKLIYLHQPLCSVLQRIERAVIAEDVFTKHRMSLLSFEENEFWFLFYHLTGLFIAHLVPTTAAVHATFDRLSPIEQRSIMIMFEECLQKHLYFHRQMTPRHLRLVSKCHGIFRAQAMKEHFPDAIFLSVLRHPVDSVYSYLSLRASAVNMLCGLDLFQHPQLLAAQYQEDIRYKHAEITLFKTFISRGYLHNHNKSGDSGWFTQVKDCLWEDTQGCGHRWLLLPYQDYTNRLARVMPAIFQALGVKLTARGHKLLKSRAAQQREYKSSHNPCQARKVYPVSRIQKDFQEYIDAFFSSNKHESDDVKSVQ